jgi:hypothetical protein
VYLHLGVNVETERVQHNDFQTQKNCAIAKQPNDNPEYNYRIQMSTPFSNSTLKVLKPTVLVVDLTMDLCDL